MIGQVPDWKGKRMPYANPDDEMETESPGAIRTVSRNSRNPAGKVINTETFQIDEKTYRRRWDRNADGQWDIWIFREEGVDARLIEDNNYDGRPDAWFYASGIFDDDYDGKPDRVVGEIAKRQETRKPW